MEKPRGYDETQGFGEYEPLALGGHICQIVKVEETTAKSGSAMVRIYLDIAEGKQKGYYAKQYRGDTRAQKRWGCVVNQVVENRSGDCSPGFKTFLTSVKQSNPGYAEVWGDGFCDSLKGKRVGGVFGREEYYDEKAKKTRFSTKCVQFRGVDAIKAGVGIPPDKLLETRPRTDTSFLDITVTSDDDLPFDL